MAMSRESRRPQSTSAVVSSLSDLSKSNRETGMRPFTSSIVGLAVIVIVLATGCVGRGADGASALPRPEGPASANGADLAGTWRGSFGQVMTGDSGWVRGDILTQIKSDGTYTTTWT